MASEPSRKRISRRLQDRRKIALLILLVLLIGVVLFQQRDARKTAGTTESTVSNQRVSQGGGQDPILMMDKLNAPIPAQEPEQRNLFSFYAPPPVNTAPEPEEVEEQPEPECGDALCTPGETFENCPSDCQPPPPPEIGLKYIGYLAQAGGPVAFLTDGKEVYMGRQNDIIANKYRVLKISDESVELGYLNQNQSTTIRFAGNQGG